MATDDKTATNSTDAAGPGAGSDAGEAPSAEPAAAVNGRADDGDSVGQPVADADTPAASSPTDGATTAAEAMPEPPAPVPEATDAAPPTDGAATAEDASPEPPAPAPEATDATSASPADAPADPAGVDAAAEPAGEPAAAPDPSETAEAGGAATGGPDASAPSQPAAAASGSEAAEGTKKKRRRRRRRRKGGASDGAKQSDGDATGSATASGADSGDGAEAKRKAARPERPAFSLGDQVFGKVCRVTEQAIFVDIAGKATGLHALPPEGEQAPAVGDQFIAKVQSSSTRGGMIMLVSEPAKPADARAQLREALEKTEPVEGWVTGVIKGGVEVDFGGVRAFGPASHVELRPGTDLSHLLGCKLPFLVTHYAKKGRDIVVSRKPMLEANAERVREEQLAKIEPDTLCKGIVRKVLGWGAFVSLPDYGDIEGVVHMSEASHDRGARLGSVMKAGDEIEVKVLRVDDKGKLWLSRKGAQKDPWEDVKERYPQWSYHRGKVVRLTDFGAFIQLEPGIDGLCHVSDLSLAPVPHPKEAVNVGDELDVVICNLDVAGRKIGLHPAPPEAERDARRPRLQAHQKVEVVVVQIRDHGLGVRIVGLTGRGQRGFIPAGHSGTPRGTDLRKEFPLGKRLEAKIIEVDPRRGEAKLSIRALKEDAEKQAYREYRKQVQREAHFGTFADLLKKS